MLTISNRVSNWIQTHPFHLSFMREGLINSAALARTIRPELESQAGEMLSADAITLALNRTTQQLQDLPVPDFESYVGEVSVQTGLSILSIPQVGLDPSAFHKALKALDERQEYSLYTRGVWHTAIIGKSETLNTLSNKFLNSHMINDAVAITIKLKPGHLELPGVCAYILQKIAFRGINLLETSSSYDEFTIIIDQASIQTALDCLI